MTIEPLLLSVTPIFTYSGTSLMTNATGFFFERENNLFLVSSRHVFIDEKCKHFPDSVRINFHTDPNNLASATEFSIPLYKAGRPLWVTGSDTSGDIDVAVIKIERNALPANAMYTAFSPVHLLGSQETIDIGSSMLIVGFPLGFYDTLHKLPVVRSAINASSFIMRFEGNGYFLTDSRTHSGSSGAPVVCKCANHSTHDRLPWMLLGIHSARLDMTARNVHVDEALGLNCAWFADILLKLTENHL